MTKQQKSGSIDVAMLNDCRKPVWKKTIFIVTALCLIALVFLSIFEENSELAEYKTSVVKPGNFSITVSASGTLQPRTTVKLGCEISGVLNSIRKDYNDPVHKGEVIAKLGTDELNAKVLQLRAALEASKARTLKADADLIDKKNEHRRMLSLRKQKAVSQKALDSAFTAQRMAEAELATARAEVRQSQANLSEAEANLKKTDIVSPIDGLVLTRHVERGQTVSSNLQTPELFTLAAGLQQMRLELNIDEADVGRIKPKQMAVFTVDAYPERKFSAVLEKLRYAPQRVQGVVTYVGVFAVENDDLALRPGMTASAKIEVANVRDRLIVPNGALRFKPEGVELHTLTDLPPDSVWILRGGYPQYVSVGRGGTNGRFTEIISGELKAGDKVILSRLEKSSENNFAITFE